MKQNSQSAKLYPAELYDQIRESGNHIICLGQEQTKTFILLSAVKNRAHQLHLNYGGKKTIIIEPDKKHAEDRLRVLVDHTEHVITDLFDTDSTIKDDTQIVIGSMQSILSNYDKLPKGTINLLIFDFAHLMLLNDTASVIKICRLYEGTHIIAFMCSLIHNNNEFTIKDTIELVNELENIFQAKCETSSDLRSLNRQCPVSQMEIISFKPSELFTCDLVLLADSLLKEFCKLILDPSLDNPVQMIKAETDVQTEIPDKRPPLGLKKQLILVRSCMSDVIYALNCLGLWCSKKTIQLYITEFSRIVHNKCPEVHLISSALSILNCFYGRLEEITLHLTHHTKQDVILLCASQQLQTLLSSIKEFRPSSSLPAQICIVHVRRKIIAKVIALWLDKVSQSVSDYSFILPNYIVGSSRKHRNRMAVDNFDLHHEAAVRDFRMGHCNVLVTSALTERCTDMPKCNLVISFDLPARFSEFIQAKGNCRYDSSKYILMLNQLLDTNSSERLLSYINLERLLSSGNRKITLDHTENAILDEIEQKHGPYPSKNSKNPATIRRSTGIINKYCSKLPSDSFTRLSMEWDVIEGTDEEGYFCYCAVRLPINSPVRQTIVGPKARSHNVALKLASFTVCKVLHQAGELDDNMMPITKESMKAILMPGQTRTDPPRQRTKGFAKNQSIGSTKNRQYYKKRIAEVFSGPLVEAGISCNLYKFKMVLTCPIPDEQNRRGRRIIDPSETNRNYAIVCTSKLTSICPFPIFTRSGEVMISVELVEENFTLSKDQVRDLRIFHEFTFSKVLRLEKYPTVYDPASSPFTVLLAPVVDNEASTSIDWTFVTKIVHSDKESQVPDLDSRMSFEFKMEDYTDAVVIPWYRLTDRQQFAYYVAEICLDMNPNSPFPDKSTKFNTFVEYYKSKYNIEIFNSSQPVLDVDHTSARLNLLTPRYVNRKGRTLPSSTAKTRRESRESLIQKQLLIPELCSIHPFPASFWRKAVCLPCIFFRLNSLFLAEELRRKVALETRVGFVEPPGEFVWKPLDFGWSIKDVVQNSQSDEDEDDRKCSEQSYSPRKSASKKKLAKPLARGGKSAPPASKQRTADAASKQKHKPEPAVTANTVADDDFVIDEFDPSKCDIPDLPLDDMTSPNWTSIKLISCDVSSGCSDAISGWDQPIKQQDIFLEHTNETTWSDCEMDYEGELSERVARVRCGSPSAFEPELEAGKVPASAFGADSYGASLPAKAGLGAGGSKRVLKFEPNAELLSNSEEEEDDEEDDEECLKSNPALEQQGSDGWSSSSEEDAGQDNERDSDYSAQGWGDWKENKAKNRPLLRELFIPFNRVAQGNSDSLIEALYRTVLEARIGGVSKCASGSSNSASSKDQSATILTTIQDLCTKRASGLEHGDEPSEQRLVQRLNELFVDKVPMSEQFLSQSLEEWFALCRDLSSRVDSTFVEEPNMFKDNEIELVTVDDSFTDYNIEVLPTFGELLPNRPAGLEESEATKETWKQIKFDPTIDEIYSEGPGPSIILQALTMSNASDGINLERLETVGDSFLKYSITAYLYCMYPNMHEGKLSYMRSNQISNAHLFKLGKARCLGELMSATKFEPNDNWLAPGYSVAESADLMNDSGSSKKREIDKALAEVPYDLLQQHSIPDKSIADCVEALIGAYLTASGSRAALLFMHWLGLSVVPECFDVELDVRSQEGKQASGLSSNAMWHWLDQPASPLKCIPPSYDEEAVNVDILVNKKQQQQLHEEQSPGSPDGFLSSFNSDCLAQLEKLYFGNSLDKFEAAIGYQFRDKAYLVQAFTHNSFYENYVTGCHQRLEFLGDALLDYLITRYLFEDPRCHSPGTLTDLRSALVNNTFFASLAVKYKFHKYLKYISDELFQVIDGFVKKLRFDSKDSITKGYTLLITEGESEYAEDIEVPKALGDVFESVAGAIYLDSGMSLDQVWRVYFKMMKPEIEYFCDNVPKSPIRELLESMPQNVRFSPSELAPDRKHRVIAEVFGLGRFTGVGRNKHSAKSTAAKRALRMLASSSYTAASN